MMLPSLKKTLWISTKISQKQSGRVSKNTRSTAHSWITQIFTAGIGLISSCEGRSSSAWIGRGSWWDDSPSTLREPSPRTKAVQVALIAPMLTLMIWKIPTGCAIGGRFIGRTTLERPLLSFWSFRRKAFQRREGYLGLRRHVHSIKGDIWCCCRKYMRNSC